jgi:hypothetical protein
MVYVSKQVVDPFCQIVFRPRLGSGFRGNFGIFSKIFLKNIPSAETAYLDVSHTALLRVRSRRCTACARVKNTVATVNDGLWRSTTHPVKPLWLLDFMKLYEMDVERFGHASKRATRMLRIVFLHRITR